MVQFKASEQFWRHIAPVDGTFEVLDPKTPTIQCLSIQICLLDWLHKIPNALTLRFQRQILVDNSITQQKYHSAVLLTRTWACLIHPAIKGRAVLGKTMVSARMSEFLLVLSTCN